MNFAVEVLVTTDPDKPVNDTVTVQRLPALHETIQDARTAGVEFLRVNGSYVASKGPDAAIAMFQIVDDGGDIVIPATRQ